MRLLFDIAALLGAIVLGYLLCLLLRLLSALLATPVQAIQSFVVLTEGRRFHRRCRHRRLLEPFRSAAMA